MVEILNRTDFAKSVNFGKYAVVNIDVTKQCGDSRTAFLGLPVRVDFGNFSSGERWIDGCELCVFTDEYNGDGKAHCTVMSYGACISASFCYEDAIKCVTNANAPLLKAKSVAVFVIHNPKTRKVRAFKVKMGMTIMHCQTAIMFGEKKDSEDLARIIIDMAK